MIENQTAFGIWNEWCGIIYRNHELSFKLELIELSLNDRVMMLTSLYRTLKLHWNIKKYGRTVLFSLTGTIIAYNGIIM